jgi:hypothetical protein
MELDATAVVIPIHFTKDLSVATMPAWRENTVHITVFDPKEDWLLGFVLVKRAIIDSTE